MKPANFLPVSEVIVITIANSLDLDQVGQNVEPDQSGSILFYTLMVFLKNQRKPADEKTKSCKITQNKMIYNP